MQTFYVKAEPLDAGGPPASAIVVAGSRGEALVLLRKDVNFSGYRLPPAEMVAFEQSNEQVRQVLGESAGHEIGVYGFAVLADEEAGADPPRPRS